MDLIKLSIPYDFIRQRTRLTWSEALFGMDNELMSSEAPVEMAVEQLGIEENPVQALIDLAGLERWESARPLVEALAGAEANQELGESRSKWLYLVLAWVFVHKESFSDPLQMVEVIYADFGYPEAVARFVRYMPSDEPDLGSRALNEQRLYSRWQSYLDELSAQYAA